jgi:hypothetical protein
MTKLLVLLPIAILLGFQVPALASPSTCTFDRVKGGNAIGPRNGLTFKQIDNDIIAIYDSLPSSTGMRNITIASSRTVTFNNTSMAAAREKLLANPALYNELLGFKAETGFKTVNKFLTCTASNSSSSSKPKSIAELADR